MKIIYTLLLSLGCISMSLWAQETVKGTVIDDLGYPLIGASILEKGTNNGSISDVNGQYSIKVTTTSPVLVFSFTGYNTIEVPVQGQNVLDVVMSEGVNLGEIYVVGSRSYKRSSTDSPVAIDVIDVADIVQRNGQLEINQFLQYVAPSFNATKQSGADGADHIDPATLRGLGPDQTLVLMNGKRRHQSSLVNIFGSRGRGNTGTDLNAIPATAIKRIEILRDGASAQYGSDAIAGVINIVLNDNTNKLTGAYSIGGFNPKAKGDFPAGTPNTPGFFLDTDGDGTATQSNDPTFDGISHKLGLNYGIDIGEGGFLNMTTEFLSKDKTLRPGATYRRGMGEAAIDGFSFMVNAAIPVSKNTEFYAFGGKNFRDTDAYAFTRNLPTARAVVDIYPTGFTPRITSIIEDNSMSAGFRTKTNTEWDLDINNTYGLNDFHYYIKGSNNASLGAASPTDMDAGGHLLSQNTTGATMSKLFQNIGSGLNLAFGTEYRTENFQIFAGEAASYGTFDVNGLLIESPDQVIPTDPVTGEERPGGSQGFPGYSPANEVDRSRSNFALYADAEYDVNDNFLLSAAGRFEKYSDFGNTFNVKAATRIKASDNFTLRGSLSTGFRAPSLVQLYYNLRFTAFTDGALSETLLAANNSDVARQFGIPQLKQEEAFNVAAGFTYAVGDFSATIDGYLININDRIVLTGYFDAPQISSVDAAAFFVNAVDTRTKGLDIVLNWKKRFIEGGILSTSFAANVNDLDIQKINSTPQTPEDVLFGSREQGFLKASAPPTKLTFTLDYAINAFNARLGLTRFAQVDIDFDNDDTNGADTSYGSKVVSDLSLSYRLNNNLNLTLGSNNLFNVYPDQQDPDNTDGGGYWDSVQMGFSGAYYFAKIGFTF